MGAFTVVDQIWYPDLTDIDQPNTWAAHIAQSISDGIGKRLAKQEVSVGLKASLDFQTYTIPAGNPSAVVPYVITANRGDFNNGFTLGAGTATVQTPGMYMVAASIGPSADTTGKSVKVQIEKNASFVVGSEFPGSATWIAAPATCVLNCIAGDTIRVKAGYMNSSSGVLNNDFTSHFSIVLVQAAP